ncbi:MAG: lipid-A-disaccharide synthase [Sediminimonas sp.]|uniref:lipid-A-disaccharide synthase n=1 Tax=Sediminimonas sp. TaxID=2823379 RepID=UPI0028701B1D|nr:lipid-A-disaccharide synthase [Sediminimonas sp.]MDR9484457.1 lipid-A-disaccharide synthase [Sediminimonas sp.]
MRVFLIAGEASGDRLGAALMAGLKALREDVEFTGVGGPMMQAEGLNSLFPMDELSVMGLSEILPKYRQLTARIKQTAKAAIEARPDVMITIDSPDFCLRVARRVKRAADIRTVHYVAPSVWAWRSGRARKMAQVIDHVLALLPFEPPLMHAAGMECDFVGHPVVSEPIADDTQIAAMRARHGLGQAPVLLTLPGSRRSEVTRLAPIFRETLNRVLTNRPDTRVVVPTTANLAALMPDLIADWPGDPVLLAPDQPDFTVDKRAAFKTAQGALAASGTVSLELAANDTPMVIAYDMAPLSRLIISRMLKVDTVTLVNLVSETRAVPEFIGKACRAERIAPALAQMLDHPQAQYDAMSLTMERLGRSGEPPGLRAARAVLDRL